MKRILNSLLVLGMLAIPTVGITEEKNSQIALTEQEAMALLGEAMIEDGQPVQVAVLSLEEMKEIEGAWLPVVIRVAGIGLKIAYHAKPHYFRTLKQALPHIQATIWKVGQSGSGKNLRIPLPRR